MDDTAFVDCTLYQCVLNFGGGPMTLERTHFIACEYVLFGERSRVPPGAFEAGLLPQAERRVPLGVRRVQ
ncbi:hypothetical protein SAMN05421771_1363 [Granulicella pectinivorans]|uniref:Uncharacterized protein n=1 Tax=Granulicella pectinivorans TaxID=474950 RepID=A0A1I6LWF9_9BACT|nr:hypothetical protein SAMN05421771_1363 [Granulicella pectinivorans]